ncbi:MAG: ParA family protein [Patescibacteria group bacterium]
MAITISFSQFKGGCGKTTSTFNIAHALALKNYKVLMIDLDPQAHLTFYAGIDENLAEEYSINETLIDEKSFPIHTLDKVDIVPSHLSLEQGIKNLSALGLNAYSRLKKPLKEVKKSYDFILLDCPPSLGIITELALISSDYVVIPTQAELLSGNGLINQIESLNKLKQDNDLDYKILGVFLTRYDSRKKLNKQIEQYIKQVIPQLLLKTKVRENISIAESPATKQDIFSYAVDSNGSQDYRDLTDEIINIINI